MKINKVICLTPDEKFLRLYRAEYECKGHTGQWTFASRKDQPEAMSLVCKPDAVIIIPFIMEDGVSKIVIAREFRVPIGDYVHAFPAGLIDDGEDIIATAKRELKEETGLELDKVLECSPPLYSSPGLSDESSVLVFVEASGKLSTENQENTESIELLALDANQIKELISNTGEFKNAKISVKCWPVLNFALKRLGVN